VDTFTYTANDGDSDEAMVTITVTPVNDAPVAVNDAHSANEDTTLNVAAPGVLANDSDAEGDPFTAAQVTGPTNGTLSLLPNGSFTYTPGTNFNGVDSFTYQAQGPGPVLGNVATVTIMVNPVNDAPVATADAHSVNEDTTLNVAAPGVLANDNDVIDGDSLTAVLVSGPTSGTLALNLDGSFTYMPNLNFFGTDSFTYLARDPSGLSDGATVTINVNDVSLLRVDRLEFKDRKLRIEGMAQQQAAITLNGTFEVMAEDDGRFRIRIEPFTDGCEVTLRDGRDIEVLQLPNC